MRTQSKLVLVVITLVNMALAWDYPVKPGTPEWNALTYQERIAVQQIPENILEDMSTEELFQAWLDLPGRLEVLAYNSMQQGFDATLNHFNVLPELMKRENIGVVALKYYNAMDPTNLVSEGSIVEKGRFITDLGFIEFFISQPIVLSTLSATEKRECVERSLDNIDKKISLKQRELFWEETNVVLLGRIMKNLNYPDFLNWMSQDPSIRHSLERGELIGVTGGINPYEDIINIARNYLSN